MSVGQGTAGETGPEIDRHEPSENIAAVDGEGLHLDAFLNGIHMLMY